MGSFRKFPRLEKDLEELGRDPMTTVRNLEGEIIKGPMTMEDLLSSAAKSALPGPFRRYSRPKLYSAMLKQLRRVGGAV